jgi:carbonic anhydrase
VVTARTTLARQHADRQQTDIQLTMSNSPGKRPSHATCCDLLSDARAIEDLIEKNGRWREQKMRDDAEFFARTGKKQSPRYLWIGCSDSRVPAEEVTGLSPGDMFVHRNIANLIVSNDISSLSVIQFAVEHLKVKDIIVCGHYGCGGIMAAMANKQLGLLDNWLRNIRDICRLHQGELDSIADVNERSRRIVEINIQEQCFNIFKINMVQCHQAKYGYPRIHGLVYDINTGALKELELDYLKHLGGFHGIYRLHNFPGDEIPTSERQVRRNMLLDFAEGHEEDPGTVSIRYIRRRMKAETELFDPEDVDYAIQRAVKRSSDPTSPFIPIQALIDYFMLGEPKATE